MSKRAVVSKPVAPCLKLEHKRFVTVLVRPPSVPGLYDVQTHQNCTHNELRALYNRHLKSYAPPDKLGTSTLRTALTKIRKRLPSLYPCSLDVLLARTPSRKKKLYTQAASSLCTHEVEQQDSFVKMFIKPDRYDSEAIDTKEPRAIQYRSPRYNLRLQQYLHPLEQAYYATSTATRGGPVKGLNSWQRAALYVEAFGYFQDPIVLNLDFSKFDAHLHPLVLQEERRFYCKCYHDEWLDWLLGMQVRNKCMTQRGLKYFVTGTRISGDVNTGLGNTLIAEGIIRAWASTHKVHMVPFVDGDDIICIFERGTIPDLDFTHWGMEATAEILEPFMLTHCQSKLVHIGERWRMVRNPFRAISHGCAAVRPYPEHVLRGLLSAMGHSELACSNGVPILQEWALAQIRVAGTSPWAKFDEALNYRARLEGRSIPLTVTSSARETFASVFDISISSQLAFEEQLRKLSTKDFLPAPGVDVYCRSIAASTSEEA